MAQNRPRRLRLIVQAKRQIGLDQPHQRLGRVGGGLVILDHDAEAVDGGGVMARA